MLIVSVSRNSNKRVDQSSSLQGVMKPTNVLTYRGGSMPLFPLLGNIGRLG